MILCVCVCVCVHACACVCVIVCFWETIDIFTYCFHEVILANNTDKSSELFQKPPLAVSWNFKRKAR